MSRPFVAVMKTRGTVEVRFFANDEEDARRIAEVFAFPADAIELVSDFEYVDVESIEMED